jgi:hypothetical protein
MERLHKSRKAKSVERDPRYDRDNNQCCESYAKPSQQLTRLSCSEELSYQS